MQEFTGKAAVVTGAASGIGQALSRGFAGEGMRVAMVDIDADSLAAATAAVRADVPSVEVTAHHCDVSDAGAVDALADSVFERWGQVDVVCNNAGVFVGGLIWERPVADLEFILGTNLWGILNGIRSFVPRMIAQGTEGHVVNTASVAGLFGAPFEAPYAISKFAAFAATESLAHDLQAVGSNIKASVLCPGMINTDITTNSERHRPDHLVTELTEDQKFVNEYLAGIIAEGMDPAEVARIVIAALRADDFLILTHDAYPPQLVDRVQELLARRLPGLPDFA
jgi:NAD(P)-dependent dehydrogenase (short-subunit alcohol dehydrogenase family)